jgi:hypothetical protein
MKIIYKGSSCKIVSVFGELESDNLLIKALAVLLDDNCTRISDEKTDEERIITLDWYVEKQYRELNEKEKELLNEQ